MWGFESLRAHHVRRHPGMPSMCIARSGILRDSNVTMKTVETENEGLKRAFMLTIPAEDIEARVDQEVKRIAPQVRMPGFRPGKVPPNLIRKMHGDALQRDALNGAVQDGVQQLLQRAEAPPGAAAARSSSTRTMSRARTPRSRSASRRCPTSRRRRSTSLKLERLTVEADEAAVDEQLAAARQLADKSWNDAPKKHEAADGRPRRHRLRRQGRRRARSKAAPARTCRSSSARAS